MRDVGPVADPAYEDSEAGLRSALAGLAETRPLDLGYLVRAARERKLKDALTGNYEPAPSEEQLDVREMVRKKLALLGD